MPPDSIRELIINAVMNCSFLQSSHIQVAIYDNRLEITSPGGLMPGVTLDKMKEGYSKIRNRALAHAFLYMNLIEAWGSGIPKLMKNMQDYGLQEPEFLDMDTDLRINLYRNTENVQLGTTQATQATQVAPSTTQVSQNIIRDDIQTVIGDEDKKILEIIKTNPYTSQREIANVLDWKIDRVKYYLKKMKHEGIVRRVGSSQKGYWEVNPKMNL